MSQRRATRSFGFCLFVLATIAACARDGETVLGGAAATGGQGGATLGSGPSTGGAGNGAGGTTALGGTTAVAVSLIDDFEDGDQTPLIGGGWFYYIDKGDGGKSTLTIPGDPDASPEAFAMTGEGYQSERSLSVEYAFDQSTMTWEPYVGVGAWLASVAAPFDASRFGGIRYVYRGSAHSVRIQTYDVKNFDYYMVQVEAKTDWTEISLPFEKFAQAGWNTLVELDLTNVESVSFQMRGPTGSTGELQIDNLGFYGTPAAKVKDFPLKEAAPPQEQTLDSIAIDNPLQAKAMQYLTRGYNITNWLEQEKFTTFKYDEAFVEQVAAAGFTSLRLPIDFDRYVDKDGAVEDTLFTVLDSFDTWTQKYGLSLTIDYHQYDESIDMKDAKVLDLAVELWGEVAAHFADNPREDLFFELLNEPEQATGTDSVAAADWTALAERMISAIRAEDQTHTILFGDVQWYGIDQLAKRQPLSDDNVIYVFHDYDPFIFTHQGTSWSGMPSTHDIPYPYDVKRWSEYSSDLGFNSSMPTWILAAAKSYYVTGSRASLYNHVAVAKKWAVKNNVPVICNEFGAYNGRAPLEDRVRYYEDMIGIFEELEIPWQHWFMVLDKDGAITPSEYIGAFGFDE